VRDDLPRDRAVLLPPDWQDDLESRFHTLVQSPLRAGLLRYLNTRPTDEFDLESLMSAFGRLRLDIENCLGELVAFGVAAQRSGPPERYQALRPEASALARLLDVFLQRRATVLPSASAR
jgi:hypothetical protein